MVGLWLREADVAEAGGGDCSGGAENPRAPLQGSGGVGGGGFDNIPLIPVLASIRTCTKTINIHLSMKYLLQLNCSFLIQLLVTR